MGLAKTPLNKFVTTSGEGKSLPKSTGIIIDSTFKPKIPVGEDTCKRGTYPKNGETFEVMNVPNHFINSEFRSFLSILLFVGAIVVQGLFLIGSILPLVYEILNK